ncbi:MAG: BatD family protein [Opitutaceae bacterium]|nr:BatD family protein [Opitutaceae bacterium]
MTGLFLVFAALVQAQSVRWETDANTPNTVQLVFEDCAPEGQPDLPAIQGATLTFVGDSQNMSMINGAFSRSVTYSYLVRTRQSAPMQIPGFTVKTNKGVLRVPAFNLAAPSVSLESVASSKLTPERTKVWAGEVFGLTYELSASRRTNPQVNQTFDWTAAPLVAEDWSKPEVTEAMVNGERRLQVVYRTRAAAKTPNTIKLEAARHLLNIQTGTVGFGFLSQPRMEPVSVTSDQPVIDVRPLPPSPAGFTGAVGEFKLVSKVVPEKAAVGEPVTWTLELSGTGNWPDIPGLPAREVSNDFQVVQPKAKRTPVEGKLFDVTMAEDVVLVPTKAGNYTLGPITFNYFDPKSGTYKTLTSPRTTLAITPPHAPQFSVTPPVATATQPPGGIPEESSAAERGSGIRGPVTAPSPPAGIPRDPLAGLATSATPLTAGTVVLWSLAPFAAWLLFWFALAVRRAKRTDPLRPRREARLRMVKTIGEIAGADEADRRSLLLAWQHDTAVIWQLSHAAPPARALEDPAWAKLWTEADRALYGAKAPLPSDWAARAQEAVFNKRIPGFKVWRLFLPQNLMPFAAVLAVGTAMLVQAIAAESSTKTDPLAAYRSADFATAEKLWRTRLVAAPTDWIARHNLALALAQQDRPGESAAHAAAAFVQHPRDPSVQWHLRLAAERAGFAPADLAVFLTDGPLPAVAAKASPAVWQRTIIGAAVVIALALGLMLANAYGRRRRPLYWFATVLIALGVISGTAAATGWHAYGIAADARAVIVPRNGTLRSIPTEVDTSQKTTVLAAGSIAIADKTFLGWARIAFENGQTGWVRSEELVPIWK